MGVAFSWHDTQSSLLEAALSRGERRIGKVIYRAWQLGSIFNSWSEHFKYETWHQAFIDCGVEPAFYANRERSMDETLPWYHIDIGVTQEFLKEEYRLSTGRKESDSCQYGACSTCGLERWIDGCGGK
ncbi:MAG: hypothetical protein NTV30_02640 [Chloroflexi bacterium]|nr:hypothetical protein [Chloroflexota bacterium]